MPTYKRFISLLILGDVQDVSKYFKKVLKNTRTICNRINVFNRRSNRYSFILIGLENYKNRVEINIFEREKTQTQMEISFQIDGNETS